MIGLIALTCGLDSLPDCSARAESTESASSLGRKLYEARKFGGAIVAYGQAIGADPKDHEAYRGRGLAYLRKGRFERAIADFDKANADLGPYRETKFPGVGAYLDWQRAHDQYEDANKHLLARNYDQAIGMYRISLSIYATFPQCLHNLAIAVSKKGDHQEAAIYCMEAISLRHTDWKFWKTLAIELFMQGNYVLALQAMEHAKELTPPVPETVEIIESIEIIKDALHEQHARSLW